MSSNLNVWGTLTFPSNAQKAWRTTELDGGGGEEESEYGSYFSAEIERETVADALDRAADAMHFVQVRSEGDAVHVRAGLSDDDWSSWTAVIGGLARAAALHGATGMLEVEDDWQFVGRLVLDEEGVRWVDSDGDEIAQDEEGKEELFALFTKALGVPDQGAPKKAAPKKKAASKKKVAPKKSKAQPKKKAAPRKKVTKKSRR